VAREESYRPILNALEHLFGHFSAEERYHTPCLGLGLLTRRADIRVLVPGAGLGRIIYEIVKAGYAVQGNELEFSMLMASNLALNG
jgi:carnosine N-methyltransferase